ncbi:(2Fe-2S)-binding protein [Christensenellaceae bacterium OttesenSCG-928-M15]|nr:(2Fe-2S)-binding protein [Christensenellaceae bacterium OttesenSCG-928-M15]
MNISFILNGRPVMIDCPPEKRLLDVLREEFHLTGAKEGCGEGECGACTVLLNGRAVHACLMMAAQAEGQAITTIEGLEIEGALHPLQKAFIEHIAVSCGFCTPGMILSALSLLYENPHPTEAEIKTALAGNICRCAGFSGIIGAIKATLETEAGL